MAGSGHSRPTRYHAERFLDRCRARESAQLADVPAGPTSFGRRRAPLATFSGPSHALVYSVMPRKKTCRVTQKNSGAPCPQIVTRMEARRRYDQSLSERGMDPPVAHPIGGSQRRAVNSFSNAHLVALAGLRRGAGFDMAQACPAGRLNDRHHLEMRRTSQGLHQPIGMIARDNSTEPALGREIHQLREQRHASIRRRPTRRRAGEGQRQLKPTPPEIGPQPALRADFRTCTSQQIRIIDVTVTVCETVTVCVTVTVCRFQIRLTGRQASPRPMRSQSPKDRLRHCLVFWYNISKLLPGYSG